MNPLVNGPLFAIVQSTVEPSMQGRVFTLLGSLSAAMSPLSLAVAGPLADKLGIPIWYIIAGVACILIGVVSFTIKPVMRLEDEKDRQIAQATALTQTSA
jgi:DHA3 family macrolide efflux protein-like MFS transporter